MAYGQKHPVVTPSLKGANWHLSLTTYYFGKMSAFEKNKDQAFLNVQTSDE